MVLTDKKKLLSRVFSRLSRESLYTALAMFFTIFLFIMTDQTMTRKNPVSA
jgi:hypothetical protein